MLALGASHLGLCNGNNYGSKALSHRVTSLASLNTALSTPCQSKEETDARYATLLALTFQSSHMTDGMHEFLFMLRGCNVVAENSLFRFEDSAFRAFSADMHVERVMELNVGSDAVQLPDLEAIESGMASLSAIAPLSSSTFDIKLIGTLQRILQMSRTSCVEAFAVLCRAYAIFAEGNATDFQLLADPENHVSQIIICHFFVIEYILAAIALEAVSPSFIFRKSIITAWVQRVSRQAPPEYRPYVQWPLDCITELSDEWGVNAFRPGFFTNP